MKKTISENVGSYYQHYPRLALVVTASANGRGNATSIAWHTSISKKPPLFCISIANEHFTYKLITESKEFGVNFIPDDKAEMVAAIGGSKGSKMDKFKTFGIKEEKAIKTKVPLIEDAYASYECRLVDDRQYGDHHLLVGEVVAIHCAEEAFMDNGTMDIEKICPTLYMGNELYLNTDGCRIRSVERKKCVEKIINLRRLL